MDKARHPHVIRTWIVERTKVLYRQPQPAKLQPTKQREFLRTPRSNGSDTPSAPNATE